MSAQAFSVRLLLTLSSQQKVEEEILEEEEKVEKEIEREEEEYEAEAKAEEVCPLRGIA